MKQQRYDNPSHRLYALPEYEAPNCKIPQRISSNKNELNKRHYSTERSLLRQRGRVKFDENKSFISCNVNQSWNQEIQPQRPSDTDPLINSHTTASLQRTTSAKRLRRHTLSDIHKAIMQTSSHPSAETGDNDNTQPCVYYTLDRDTRVGAISPEEANRKRVAFLRYLERSFPDHADAISTRTLHELSLSEIRTRASYSADSNQDYTSVNSSVQGGSLTRGGRLRSSLPIVRSRSRSRERPLGVIYLEYSGESRAVLLPNELTSLDTIRALFVQAYPGLLTMPMLTPQRHNLLLKNKKNGNFEEIENISRIKDRSTVRARPTGIPTPGKKPVVHQKSKIERSNQPKPVEDPVVAEKNQKNQQKSGLKAPVKSLIRQYQNGAKATCAIPSSSPIEANNRRSIPKANETAQKSTKPKAPPPPPRSAKPTLVTSSPKLAAAENINTANGSLRSGIGLGGGSVPHKGFSYLPSSFSPNKEIKQTNPDSASNLQPPSSLPLSLENNQGFTSFRNSQSTEDSDPNVNESSKTPPMQPRMYAGSPMAAQTQFSSAPQGDSSNPKVLKPKNYESRLKNSSHFPKAANVTSPNLASEGADVSKTLTERKEVSQSTSTSSLFGLTSRSYKGNQPKPFSIPVVPDVSRLSKPSDSSPVKTAPTNTSAETTASVDQDTRLRTSSFSNTSVSSDKIQSGDESPGKEKSKPAKKGLFGLRKLVSNKNTANKQNSLKKSQSTEVPASIPSEVPAQSILFSHSPQTSELSIRSGSFSESSPSSQRSQLFKNNGSKSPTVKGKKASIPKTDLLHSLLNHKADKKDQILEHSDPLTRDNYSPSSSVYSDGDPCQTTAGVPGLTGVLKNSNLVKSTSSSSILTDSGASNLSTTPSMKTKKVSFQDNVTVCDGNVISTFSNSLRHPDLDNRSLSAVGSLEGQSLSHDVTEEGVARSCAVIRPWQSLNQFESPTDERYTGGHDLPAPPPSGYMQYSFPSNVYPPATYIPPAAHQSAVAAAIESISSKPVVSMSSHYQPTPTTTQATNVYQKYDQFSVSCASPVPFITRQDRGGSAYKEEWDLPKRISADVNSIPHESALAQQRSAPSNPGDFLSNSKNIIENRLETEADLSYFQTQQTPGGHKDPFHSDTPPYYECCTSSTPTNHVTPSQISENLNQRNRIQPSIDTPGNFNNSKTINTATFQSKPAEKSNRMMVRERSGATRTGTVEPITTNDCKSLSSPAGENQYSRYTTSSAAGQYSARVDSTKQNRLKNQLLKLRETTINIKDELNEMKKQQRCNIESINEMMNEKTKDIAQFIASTAGAQHRPLRLRRIRLDQQRHTYGARASNTEKQLSDVEAAVEELRNEVVERRCRVNAREVEALVLQLSQAGRTIAQLKGSFPSLCDELRTVGAAETEVIYAEEKFTEAEPLRLDEQLKRCKQLTATLYTLKKLANVQEARSKTPTSFAQLRPTTPCQMMSQGANDSPRLMKDRLLGDVRRVNVDHRRRMESIQALEIAEKALNRTDYISLIEERRRSHLVDLYNNRGATAARGSNLTTSESSSIESLPPPPPPNDGGAQEYPKAPFPSGYPYSVPSTAVRQAPMDLKIPRTSGGFGYGVMSPDVGYLSSDPSPDPGRIILPPGNTGSLPRYTNSSAYRLGYGHPAAGRSHQNFGRNPDGFERVKGMERSRSVTPQRWDASALEVAPFSADLNRGYELTNEERQLVIEKQRINYDEKNKKLKDQYSKLQQLQRRQRTSFKKAVPVPNKLSSFQNYQVSSGAKSSDV